MQQIFSLAAILVPVLIVGAALVFMAFLYRTVVETNIVHIVQSRKKTISYGTSMPNGNVYYSWPSFLPLIGVKSIILPVSNFNCSLKDYKAYDKNRVPFELDVTAFFRISDTNIAAQRVSSFKELELQLLYIVQGAVRKILASHDVNNIMVDRATFGQQFTDEVANELKNWGVEPVKNMELMDIRDTEGSKVISNIMAKKTSFIEMESRKEVASNRRDAEVAEIEAKQSVEVRQEEAKQKVGERRAEQEKLVGVAKELSEQEIKSQAAETKRREMAVLGVETQRRAEIAREAAVTFADQERQEMIMRADGHLEEKKRHAEAVKVEGEAKAEAERLMQLAPINAQIELAKEIGENSGYQTYLVSLREIEAKQVVGIENAKALIASELKIIVSSGDVQSGVKSLTDLLSTKGGTQIAAMLEGMKQTPEGSAILDALKR